MTTNIKHERANQVCVTHFTKEGPGLVLGKVVWRELWKCCVTLLVESPLQEFFKTRWDKHLLTITESTGDPTWGRGLD